MTLDPPSNLEINNITNFLPHINLKTIERNLPLSFRYRNWTKVCTAVMTAIPTRSSMGAPLTPSTSAQPPWPPRLSCSWIPRHPLGLPGPAGDATGPSEAQRSSATKTTAVACPPDSSLKLSRGQWRQSNATSSSSFSPMIRTAATPPILCPQSN